MFRISIFEIRIYLNFMPDLRKEFGNIYDRYVDKIYRFVFLKVNSEEVAQDITSETFLKGWERYSADKQNSGNEIKNPRAFLYRIARNLIVDHYRQKNRVQIVPADDARIVDPKIDLQGQAARMSDLVRVKQALSELNDDYQNVIIWRYIEGLSVSETARLLGRTNEATRVLTSRALKALRTKLG
ncbi:MAG: hypothetical protein DRI01_01780 [Chloroflexi bacterium]|nr:MAG: hypothetical protein DRI01_01780 [Chloroflexota bacterium]